MTPSNDLPILMSIDTRKNRIRLHKSTLHRLGDPKFIQLLVDPENKAVAIRPLSGRGADPSAHQVLQRRLFSDDSVEIYSLQFIKQLLALVPGTDRQTNYRLSGRLLPRGLGVYFDLASLEPTTKA